MKTNQTLRYSIALLLAIVIFGCKAKPKSTPPPTAASRETVAAIRNAYFRAYPDSRVGVVIVARKPDKLVAVGEVSGIDFREGQTVVFLDAHQKVLANGTVVRVLADQVHVAYEKEKGGRDPVVGDVMVRIPVGGTTL